MDADGAGWLLLLLLLQIKEEGIVAGLWKILWWF